MWGGAAGLRMVQLLPVNDTSVHMTWWDSYPYSSVSVRACGPRVDTNCIQSEPIKSILS